MKLQLRFSGKELVRGREIGISFKRGQFLNQTALRLSMGKVRSRGPESAYIHIFS